MSLGRSDAAWFRLFCAVTTPCWALATARFPFCSSTSFCFSAESTAFCAVTTALLAELTEAWSLGTLAQAADAVEDGVGGTVGMTMVVVGVLVVFDELDIMKLAEVTDPDEQAAWSALSWSWALSSAFLAWLSWRLALSMAVSSASCTASAWSLVFSRIFSAWSRDARALATAGESETLLSVACCVVSWPRAWSSDCCAANGSTVASTWPAVTRSPTFTFTAVS